VDEVAVGDVEQSVVTWFYLWIEALSLVSSRIQ